MKKQLGFTLLELMVVVAVIAILAAIALTSYRNQVLKSKRSEAKQVLNELALKEEKWRLNNATYTATTGTGGLLYFGGPSGSSTQTPTGYYTVAITTPGGNCPNGVAASSGNSFRITATAAGDQAEDTDCATIILTSMCGTIQKTSTGGGTCW